MTLLADALAPLVPGFEYLGRPTADFPYPFAGYRRVTGVSADRVSPAEPEPLAGDLGRFLSRLHRMDPAGVPPTPSGSENESRAVARVELVAVAHVVRPLLDDDLLARAGPVPRR